MSGRSPRFRRVGVSLAIVRHLVETHGGQVWVRSQPQEGGTVGFALPAVDETSPPNPLSP